MNLRRYIHHSIQIVIPVPLAAACWQKLSKSPVGRDSVKPGRMSSGDARLPPRAVIGEKTFNENEHEWKCYTGMQ